MAPTRTSCSSALRRAGSVREQHVYAAVLGPTRLVCALRIQLTARGGRHLRRVQAVLGQGLLNAVCAAPGENEVVFFIAARVSVAHELHAAPGEWTGREALRQLRHDACFMRAQARRVVLEESVR